MSDGIDIDIDVSLDDFGGEFESPLCERMHCDRPKDAESPLFLCAHHQRMVDNRELGWDETSQRPSEHDILWKWFA